MSTPLCPVCASIVFVESLTCPNCAAPVAFHYPSLSFVSIDDDVTVIDGGEWSACSNRNWGCNWVADRAEPSAQCFSCRLVRRKPDAADTIILEKMADANVDKRRLLIQLLRLGLPIVPFYEREGGLAFDLLSSTSGERVMIGHANGVITLDLAETLDDWREKLRVRLGEAYRTMLGHFRHEIGHYYQYSLVDTDDLWAECRALFGDERSSYRDAIDRHYKVGAPENWRESFLSEYATMHPWEDFAETFAHYLHITGTLTTAAGGGLYLDSDRVEGFFGDSVEPLTDYSDQSIERVLDDWHWLSIFFNRINRAMGMGDLYPFQLNEPARVKLGFVHRIITRASSLTGVAS